MNETQARSGRKEVLTLQLARKIVKLIERMPDAEIPVTWDNVILHAKRQFGTELRRNVLSQKEWDGRKLIAEAFKEAKGAQRRLLKQAAPKYVSSPRAVLRKRIELLEAKVLALKQELDAARASHYTQVDVFRVTRLDLRRLAEQTREREAS